MFRSGQVIAKYFFFFFGKREQNLHKCSLDTCRSSWKLTMASLSPSLIFKLPICKPNIYIKEKAYYTVARGKDISAYTNEQGEMEIERKRNRTGQINEQMEKTTNKERTQGRVMAVIPDSPPANVLYGKHLQEEHFHWTS